jgi:CRISPR-associated protein Csm4
MTTWRLRLLPLSQWATPLRADSLFGSLCWRWRELFPESFESILDEFHQGTNPPFVLSDGWPGDYLPLPMSAEFTVLAHEAAAPQKKKLKPPLYVSQEDFSNVIRGGIVERDRVLANMFCPSARVQTAIDRDLGAAAEGMLFETGTQYLHESCETVSVYLRSERYLDQTVACFNALARTGFGKRSSTGLGQFEIAAPERWDLQHQAGEANAFVTLNHFVPAPNDPTEGLWRTHVTYPKFHANSVSNVFKGSILTLTPGSVFRTPQQPQPSWYGSMIPVPRPEMPKALHYGLCLPVPMTWPTGNA